MSNPKHEDFLFFSRMLADQAAMLAKRYFRSSLQIEDKSDASPVTQADKEIEALIRREIKAAYPDHGILGEEQEAENLDRDYVWVIDPIDGTRAFATGFPAYGCLIALLYKGEPICGLCDMPSLGERFSACSGQATQWNNQACRVSAVKRLQDARLRCTSHAIFSAIEMPFASSVMKAARFTHNGGDCLNYCLLAAGHCDLVLEAGLAPYDVLALRPIIEEAGGIISDWQGQPLSFANKASFDGRVLASASLELHEQALAYLVKTPPN